MKRLLVILLFVGGVAQAYKTLPNDGSANVPHPMDKKMGFDQKPGTQVPGDLAFVDDTGKAVQLKEYFGKTPVIVAMVYYGCPNLCGMVMNGTFKALEDLPFTPGKDFSMVFVSINPAEKFELAAKKKKNYLAKYRRAGAQDNVHFLTGEQANITKLADTLGFRYAYDEATKQYAHPAGVMVLTNDGVISRYLYGIEFAGKDLRLALVEASENKIGSVVDQFLLFCFHYDPVQGTYGMTIMKILRLFGVITVVAVGSGVGYMLYRERQRNSFGGAA